MTTIEDPEQKRVRKYNLLSATYYLLNIKGGGLRAQSQMVLFYHGLRYSLVKKSIGGWNAEWLCHCSMVYTSLTIICFHCNCLLLGSASEVVVMLCPNVNK